MSAFVHPQAQQILDGKAAAGGPPLWEQSPDEARAWFDAANTTIPAGPDLESVADIVIPGQSSGIPARVYSPSARAPGVIVYFHGGGWVVGSLDGWDSSARALAVASGCDVVSVDYRLAPEHVFPAAADDAFDALCWVASPSGFSRGRPVVVAGDSAGGNLAAVSALRARDSGGPAIALQVLVYPVTDCDLDRRSYRDYDGDEFIVNRQDMAWFWDHYAPDRADRVHPFASPLRAAVLSGLPPAYLVTAEHDPLRDEGFAYADRLRGARVRVEHRHYGSQIHGFFTFTGVLDDADKAVADAAAAIRSAVDAQAAELGQVESARLLGVIVAVQGPDMVKMSVFRRAEACVQPRWPGPMLFYVYVFFLLFSGVMLLGMGALKAPYARRSRTANFIVGTGFTVYGLYLVLFLRNGHYFIFFYAFLLPVLLAVRFYRERAAYRAWTAAGSAPPAGPARSPGYGNVPPTGYGNVPPAYGQQAAAGYGQPPAGYGNTPPAYGQPQPGYGQPQPGYGQPQDTYGQPQAQRPFPDNSSY